MKLTVELLFALSMFVSGLIVGASASGAFAQIREVDAPLSIRADVQGYVQAVCGRIVDGKWIPIEDRR